MKKVLYLAIQLKLSMAGPSQFRLTRTASGQADVFEHKRLNCEWAFACNCVCDWQVLLDEG